MNTKIEKVREKVGYPDEKGLLGVDSS